MDDKSKDVLAQIALSKQRKEAIQALWLDEIGEPPLSKYQLSTWLNNPIYGGFDTVCEAIRLLPTWLNKLQEEHDQIVDQGRKLAPEEEANPVKSHDEIKAYVSRIMLKKAAKDDSRG